MNDMRYRTLNSFLREKFGCRVHKITVDAGMNCPNRDGSRGVGGCIYCNERGSGTGVHGIQSITEQLELGKTALSQRYKAKKFLAYFQAFSNTYAPLETLRAVYEEALAVDDICGLTIGTRPDCVDDSVLDLIAGLNERAYVSVEYGLQSAHDRTLLLINRGHDYAEFLRAVEMTASLGIDITVHVILGLPGETKEDMLETARRVSALPINGIKIHFLYMVRGTALHRLYEKGEYHCMSRENYIDTVCDFIALLPPQMIIHRLTGDPHKNELVAPAWSAEKNVNLNAVRAELEKRDVRQGCRFGS